MARTYKDDKYLLSIRCEAYKSNKVGTWDMQSKKDYSRVAAKRMFLREKSLYCR